MQGAERDALGIPTAVGDTITFGVPVVYNVGDGDVTLERAELDRPSPGVTHVGTLATGTSRTVNFGSGDDHFPPRNKDFGKPRPLEGATVSPVKSQAGKAGVELLVGLRATRLGHLEARGLIMHYRVGDQRWRVRVPQAFRLCVDKTRQKRPPVCDAPPVPARDGTKVGRE